MGKAICLEIAKTGTPVIINYQSNETAANEVKTMIEAQGGQATLMRFDVSKPEEVENALEAWQNEHADDYIAFKDDNPHRYYSL